MDSPLRWMGGKSALRGEIIRHLPAHRTYVEPFGGAAWVLFGKPESPVEILNDINGDLVNLWRVVQQDPDRLTAWLSEQLVSEEIFQQYKAALGYARPPGPGGIAERPGRAGMPVGASGDYPIAPERNGMPETPAGRDVPKGPRGIPKAAENGMPTMAKEGIPSPTSEVCPSWTDGMPSLEAGQDPAGEYRDDIARAGMFYYLVQCSIMGIAGEQSRFGHSRGRRSGYCQWSREDWSAVQERLREVTILRRDFRDVFRVYDHAETCFYVDPPYMVSTDRAGHYYRAGFSEQDHRDLADILRACRGTWILSYDDDPRVVEIYRDFPRRTVEVDYGSGRELLISNRPFIEGPYRVQESAPGERNGRWDTPRCPHCHSRQVTYAYHRRTLDRGARTYEHGDGNYICQGCGKAFHWTATNEGIPATAARTLSDFGERV